MMTLRRLTGMIRAHSVFLLYTSSSLLLNIAVAVSSIAVLRWVEPRDIGIWQMLLLVQSYALLLRFGVASGLGRELPFFLGKGDRARALLTAETAQVYLLGCGGVGAVAFLTAAAISASWEWRLGWLAAALIWPAQLYASYLKSTCRANQEFKRFSKAQLAEAAAHIFSVALVWRWGFEGLAGRAVLVAVFGAAVLHWVRPLRVGFRFDWETFKLLVRTGTPTHVYSYIYTLALGFDRIILVQLGSVLLVGYYAPVAAVITGMGLFTEAVISYTYPRLSYRLGKQENAQQLWRPALLSTLAGMGMAAPAALLGWMVVPAATEKLFPAYAASVPAMQLALVTGVLLSARTITTPLVSLKAWKYAYTYMVLFAGAKWMLPWLLARSMDPLIGVTVGSAAAAAIMAVVGFALTHHATHARTVPVAVAKHAGAAL